MANDNLLDQFTGYIESLCAKHTSIRHSPSKKHFVRLDNDELLQEGKSNIFYPVVVMEKLTITYSGLEDSFRKSRHIELLFLDHVRDAGNFGNIESIFTNMESIAEDFLKKIRIDKRDTSNYPFLKSLVISNAEIEYVENIHTHLWGVLLAFDMELPFNNCIAAGRFE
ncbi:hypothetical protein M2132_001820 [Dysgonomonas sp. PH5-45]|uniref:hypothetical protein n=1 Tax=unclassified Dysgonomonas TaxID=2630389 RepID=UPI002476884F|nr:MULTISPECIES: hypothetical protein [unclassified Dysgonomonas]MDH6355477.1 hypothetical protein [Dysgonomonas sp. PH5-45]MDH6388373.1 hypothetical protein [Dysgonomonas sp. PH5-37]